MRLLILTLILLQSSTFLFSQNENITCNNWLKLTSYPSAVSTGDIDVVGNKITVEAIINRTQPYLPGVGHDTEGDVVSKHTDPANINYLLRPNHAYITTNNGFFGTPDICNIELNKSYHVAMVYDGAMLKFYRNGYLMSQISATGNLFQNNFNTRIGLYDGTIWRTQFLGYINEVRIWNVARTQSEIRTYMNSSLPNPTSQTGLLAYYTFDNLLNKQGNSTWNGTLTGSAVINQINPSCTFIEDSCKVIPCSNKNDFSFNLNPCNPKNIAFETNATGYNRIRWNFGDGNTISNTSTPSNTYINFGNYGVTMITDYTTCSDTVTKTITVSVQDDNQLITTNDTTICFGDSKQLMSSSDLKFCWSPSNYLNNITSANPITTTPDTITYYLHSLQTGENLIVNGNFSSGNSGFASEYLYSPSSGVNPGVYNVGSNILSWHSGMAACNDHTTGSGNMLMVNGSTSLNTKVWSQTLSITPNTNYIFSAWIQNITFINPASLQFSINGNNIGSVFNANTNSCIWERFYTTWNSGNSTFANISIVNQNNIFSGNDFALDDILFAPVMIRRDSVKILVDSPFIRASRNATICEKDTIHLNVSGAATYSWSPVTGLTNPNISNPVASPVSTTKYIVTGTTINGCSTKDSIIVIVNPVPVISLTNDTIVCASDPIQLNASGGTSFLWTPSNTLNANNIPNPIALPVTTTIYYVTVSNNFNCKSIDSVRVEVRSANAFSINPPISVCKASPVQLMASGGDLYNWSPAGFLNNAAIANPVALAFSTTPFSVTITDTLCNNSTTLNTTVNVFPDPLITAGKSNDIDCTRPTSNLSANGGVQYAWLPAATLNNPNIANPVASPVITTKYVVTATDIHNCANKDSITVYVSNANKSGYLMPTAFTPNNDGVNDCYGIKYWGIINELEFSIYNRWGERVYFTKDPGGCWDGTYKGQKQDGAVFVYMIKAKTTCQDYVFRKGTFVLIR